jgi:hypothetical protein
VKVFTGACLLVAITAASTACAGSHRVADGTQIPAKTITSSRLILGGRVRCTATASTPVEAGQPLGVTFAFHNVSNRAVKVSLAPWGVRLVFTAGDGTRFDTQSLVSPTIPYIPPTKLGAGVTRTVAGIGSLLRVRWRGPLRITPACGQTRLPVLRLGVIAAGPPLSKREAIADVVGAAGHLFDHCQPQAAGVAVLGQIDAPDGNAPPLNAACSVHFREEGSFWRAQALVLSPPGIRYVSARQRFAELSHEQGRNAEEIVWEFVVTRNGAVSVDASELDASKPADRMADFWQWNGSRWERAGDGRCGGFGTNGGAAAGPTVDFITVCRR